MSRPLIGITPGEPAGIGPDICLMAFTALERDADLVFFTDPVLMQERAEALGIDVDINHAGFEDRKLNVHRIPLDHIPEPGQPADSSAGFVIDSLSTALNACLQKQVDAIVTGPVNKALINRGGFEFSGHTEWFADATATRQPVMLLASGSLRVAVATTHLPLRDVPASITQQLLHDTLSVMHNELQSKFGIRHPVIGVCGLNPHAGEDGQLGTEEIDTIIPALDSLRRDGLKLIGPLPADTAFTQPSLDKVDAILAMYHDQGLSVLKHAAFGDAINITLGLPVIRTSVDHGTAFELAGTGKADPSSLIAAVNCAIDMTTNR